MDGPTGLTTYTEGEWPSRGRTARQVLKFVNQFELDEEWFGLEFHDKFQQEEYRILTDTPSIRWSKEYIITVKDDWVHMWMRVHFKTMVDQVAAMLMR